jgi:hypothetical protein
MSVCRRTLADLRGPIFQSAVSGPLESHRRFVSSP